MRDSSVEVDVKDLVAEYFAIAPSDINADTPLTGVDSLDMLDFAFALEKHFHLDLLSMQAARQLEIADFRTVGDVCRAIERAQQCVTS